jgi:hypothetical protein
MFGLIGITLGAAQMQSYNKTKKVNYYFRNHINTRIIYLYLRMLQKNFCPLISNSSLNDFGVADAQLVLRDMQPQKTMSPETVRSSSTN